MIHNIGDIFSSWHEDIEKWCCVQVINRNESGYLTIVILDAFFDTMPSEGDLGDIKGLIQDHHNFKGEPMVENVGPDRMDMTYHFIANRPVVCEEELYVVDREWPKNHDQIRRQYIWNQLPTKLTENYESAKKSDDKIDIGGFEFNIKATRVNINDDKRHIDFQLLSSLPALTDLHLFTDTRDPAPFLRNNPLIHILDWEKHGRSEIDISGTYIQSLTVEVDGLKRLILNDAIRRLILTGDLKGLGDLTIDHPKKGKWLEMHIVSDQDFDAPDFNLPNLQSLRLKLHKVDFANLGNFYPALSDLKIWGNPGVATNLDHMKNFKALDTLWLFDMFGYEVADFPAPDALPMLSSMRLMSIPKDVGDHVKKTFKHIRSLDVAKLRSEKWLAENLNNPFRSWDGRDGISNANAKKAFNIFKTVNSAIEKGVKDDVLLAIFDNYIDVFNLIESKKGGIDTMEREEIYSVYMDLARRTQIKESVLFERFEARRLD